MATRAEQSLEEQVARIWPLPSWRNSHVLLAVSGGPDSVAMLRVALALKSRAGGEGRLFVAHFHHGVRGVAADEDLHWLERLCRQRDVPLEVGRADVAKVATEDGDGWEAAARTARYEFLRQSAERVGARWVAVGHTADDQTETVLHHILRGTGLAGLAGIPRVRPLSPSVTLIRPLLETGRGDVLEYLAAVGQEFRTDATNADSRWTRNRLRNELLPTLRANFNPEIGAALRRLAQQADEAQQVVAGLADDLARSCATVNRSAGSVTARIDCRVLSREPQVLIREVCKATWAEAGWPLQAMGFDEWQQLAELCCASQPAGMLNLPGNILVRREGELLVLAKAGGDATG